MTQINADEVRAILLTSRQKENCRCVDITSVGIKTVFKGIILGLPVSIAGKTKVTSHIFVDTPDCSGLSIMKKSIEVRSICTDTSKLSS